MHFQFFTLKKECAGKRKKGKEREEGVSSHPRKGKRNGQSSLLAGKN